MGQFIITSYIVFCLFFANLSRIGKENYLSKKVGVTTHDIASHCHMIELRVQLGCSNTISLNILKHLPPPLRALFCYFSCLLNCMRNIFLPSVHVLHVHVCYLSAIFPRFSWLCSLPPPLPPPPSEEPKKMYKAKQDRKNVLNHFCLVFINNTG